MSLPSQSGLSLARRGTMYRQRRGKKKFSLFLVLAAAGAITWFMWPDDKPADLDEVAFIEFEQIHEPSPIPEPALAEVREVVLQEDAWGLPEENTNPSVAVGDTESTTIVPLAATTKTSTNLDDGLTLLDNNQLAAAQRSLSASLRSGLLTPREEAQARGVLADLADHLVFSHNVDSSDPFSIDYTVRSGDTLSEIVHKMGLQVDWRFIQRINNISNDSIRVGQSLKLVTGPFHAVIDKETYKAHLYLGDGNDQVFVRSFRVGLGEYNSTPTGLFKVRRNSKLINPPWTNPRTREFYTADNPMNPIGERWIGLEGIDERTKDLSGLGLHGTIEPGTIGTDSSMGCVRMHSEDVSQVYEMLVEGVSTVEIK